MEEYADNKGVLVADVDCTAAGKDLCATHKITGYPSIKYGDPGDLKDYKGERTLEALQALAQTLEPRQPTPAFQKAVRSVLRAVEPVREDVDHILKLRKNAAAMLLVGGVLIGFVLGLLAAKCCCSGQKIARSTEKPKKA